MNEAALRNLLRIGQIKEERPSKAEFEGLISSGRTRLNDAQLPKLNIESRFDLAYNAAHALSLAALRYHGYRPAHRYTAFQTLRHTLDLPNEKWRILDQAHRKRNLAEYEGLIDVDASLVDSIIRVAKEIEVLLRQLPSLGEN